LLRPFQQEFGVECVFDNPKVAAECDIIFICILPSQIKEVLKEIRDVIKDRITASKKNKMLINPLLVCTCAAISYQKLRLMLSDEAIFLRTTISVPVIKEYLMRTQAIAQMRAQTDDGAGSRKSQIREAEADVVSKGSHSSNMSATPDNATGGKSRKFDHVLSSKAV
jgi:hypothetical protein